MVKPALIQRMGGAASRIAHAVREAPHLRLYDRRGLSAELERQQLKRIFDRFDVDCVFDIGANRGQYARMVRRGIGFDGDVFSFEPLPDCAAFLKRVSARHPRWHVEEIAIAGRNGEQTLSVMAMDVFSSLSEARSDQPPSTSEDNRPVQKIPVKTETLSAAYNRLSSRHGFRRPFLKMDTQGYDTIIVESGKDILHHFVGLQSELAITQLYETSVRYDEAIRLYESFGFTLSALFPSNAKHFPDLLEVDCIMLNNRYRNP